MKLTRQGAVTNVRTGERAIPRIPGLRYLPVDEDGRETLADWLASPENPYFARSFVNRLWHGAFGRGLVEPPDDMRATNPATHPELLDHLAFDFIEHGYDLRHTLAHRQQRDLRREVVQPITLTRTTIGFIHTHSNDRWNPRFWLTPFMTPRVSPIRMATSRKGRELWNWSISDPSEPNQQEHRPGLGGCLRPPDPGLQLRRGAISGRHSTRGSLLNKPRAFTAELLWRPWL